MEYCWYPRPCQRCSRWILLIIAACKLIRTSCKRSEIAQLHSAMSRDAAGSFENLFQWLLQSYITSILAANEEEEEEWELCCNACIAKHMRYDTKVIKKTNQTTYIAEYIIAVNIPVSKAKLTACTIRQILHKVSRVLIAYNIIVRMVSALYRTAAARANRYNILSVLNQQLQWATDCPTQSGASSLNVLLLASCKNWGITIVINWNNPFHWL